MKKDDNEKKKAQPGCGCFVLIVAFLGVYSGLYSSFFPSIKGIGPIGLGEVTTNTYNNASTDFMHFDRCSWLATAKSLKTYAVCYETTGYTKHGVEYLIDVLTKEHSNLAIDRITDAEVNLQRQLATNELSACAQCITFDVSDGYNLMNFSENQALGRKVDAERRLQLATNVFSGGDYRITADKLERMHKFSEDHRRLRTIYAEGRNLQRIMKRDHERWVLRLKIDEYRHDSRGIKDHFLRSVYNCFMFCRNLFPIRKRHVAVFERVFEGGKEKLSGSSACGNLNQVGVILIAWDDDLMEENVKESR